MKNAKCFVLLFLFGLIITSNIQAQDKFPEWARGIVWYQIFPERFADGDTSNDSSLVDKVDLEAGRKIPGWKITKWTSDWYAESKWEKKLGGSFISNLYERRYGGDLQGIIDHLDYLKKLGVGAIYLNPVFDAVSLHKYDASTYHHIDVNFGPDPEGDKKIIASEDPDDPSTWKWTSADKLFLKLIEEVHKLGMKIIIDGVFNHTGLHFWAFQDIIKNREKSKYKDWYKITSFGDKNTELKYKGWSGVKSLPEFNRTQDDLAPGPKQYIFYITKRWMDPNNDGNPSDGIDGWRLDVANEIPMGFWRSWRNLVKSINPQALITGELWGLYTEYVSKNGPFDALMNYSFAFAVNQFFIAKNNKITAGEFIKKLQEIDKSYPERNLDMLQNLVDSHDTERISSMIANPDREYDHDADYKNPNYNVGEPTPADYKKQEFIAAFQMTFRGAPMIYYGDEVGMWGADDPNDRQPMVWSNLKYDNQIITPASGFKKGFGIYKVEQNNELLSLYKKVIKIRNDNPALKYGSLNFLYSNDKRYSFAFERDFNSNKIIAVFNAGDKGDEFDLSLNGNKYLYEELMSGEKGNISGSPERGARLPIQIPSGSFKIYKLYSMH